MLIVETGQGVINADSYVSIEEVARYCADYGYTWETAESNESILRNASQYIDLRYRAYITGTKLNSSQGLNFPRIEAEYKQNITDDEAFAFIKKATLETCVLLSQGKALYNNTSNEPVLISESLASGAVTSKWDISNLEKLPQFSKVNAILYPLFGEINNNSLEADSSNEISTIKLTRG